VGADLLGLGVADPLNGMRVAHFSAFLVSVLKSQMM
jgi:hypothetical protein